MADYEGAKCIAGHQLELVSEGYAVCSSDHHIWWHAWALTKPATPRAWTPGRIIGKDGKEIPAWVKQGVPTKKDALLTIATDIAAHRLLPFDEERERERLMPV